MSLVKLPSSGTDCYWPKFTSGPLGILPILTMPDLHCNVGIDETVFHFWVLYVWQCVCSQEDHIPFISSQMGLRLCWYTIADKQSEHLMSWKEFNLSTSPDRITEMNMHAIISVAFSNEIQEYYCKITQ